MMRCLYAIFLVALLAGCGEAKLPSPFQASDVSARYAAADFHLTDHGGKPRSLADFSGKVAVLFFGYTHCPEICPSALADLAQAMRLLGKDAERVQVLFVTLDPERDTRELLAQYVPAFHPSFLGLYGDAQATGQAAGAFGVVYKKQGDKDGYTLDHSAGTFMIGTNGRPLLLAPYGQRPEKLAQDMQLLLRMAN